jgi:hypothetical protein
VRIPLQVRKAVYPGGYVELLDRLARHELMLQVRDPQEGDWADAALHVACIQKGLIVKMCVVTWQNNGNLPCPQQQLAAWADHLHHGLLCLSHGVVHNTGRGN